MKKLILLFTIICFAFTQAQSDITNVMQQNNSSTLMLGCCDTDGLNHPDFPVCLYPDFAEYYVTEDVDYQRLSFTLRNAHIEFRNGASFITNGAVMLETCNASITFTGGGGLFESRDIMNASLGLPYFEFVKDKNIIGLPYSIINIAGQVIRKGIVNGSTKNLRSTDQLYFLIVKGYQAKKMPFKN
jgi:hypothetical protein